MGINCEWCGLRPGLPLPKRMADLHRIIARVLSENESRCLDDEDDREVVLRELLKALSA